MWLIILPQFMASFRAFDEEFKLLLPRKLVELTRFAASQRAEPLKQII